MGIVILMTNLMVVYYTAVPVRALDVDSHTGFTTGISAAFLMILSLQLI